MPMLAELGVPDKRIYYDKFTDRPAGEEAS